MYAVITITFLVVVYTPDTNLAGRVGAAAFAGASPEQLEQIRQTYLAARGREKPLLVRYTEWLINISLFRWGFSPSQGAPVLAVLERAIVRTVTYLIPGALLAWLLGTAVGLRSARAPGSPTDTVSRLASYVLFGVPGFWLAALLIAVSGRSTPTGPEPGTGLVWTLIAPAGVLAAGLLAGQVSLTRSRSIMEFDSAYVRLLRAKGLSQHAVTVRVFRNVLTPILSLSAAELFSVLVLAAVVIETVFGIEGVGWLTITAARENDIPLILGTTMVLVGVGVGGSLLVDAAATYFDPRRAG